MSRQFTIHEEYLADLERLLPQFSEELCGCSAGNKVRTQLRQVQRILSDVRWGYGPPKLVDTIPADEPS